MLSVENPSDPPPLKSDQTKVAFHDDDDDDHHHLPTFSIRDYVFTSRPNHIDKNWPFSHHHLQLCSKHEIKDLLPPFEPPDSIRKHCLRKGRRQLVSQFDTKKSIVEFTSLQLERYPCQAPDKENLTLQPGLSRSPGSDHAVEIPVIDYPQFERESSPTNARIPFSLQEDSCTLSDSPLDLHNTQLGFQSKNNKTTVETSGSKCRLILKLGPLSDLAHTEDITSNTATISDSMASKVCPVCKTFSSTSNTTLNAHIDQCLSVESTSKWIMNDAKLTKHIVKPTKKRSMVDIYTTATQCTLEELDRRNGTNWAANSNLLTAEAKATADEERQKLSGAELEDSSDECPVYFDSNGTKLRIISKFSNASISTQGDGLRKPIIDGKESKIISFNGKKHFRPKNAKRRKSKLRKKKLCYLQSNEVGIPGAQEMKHKIKKGFDKEESLSQILKARDQIICNEPGTLKKWVCSKRTGLLKRISGKDNRLGLGFPSSITVNPLIENNKMDLGDSSGDLNPSESAVSSLKTINLDSSCYESQVTDRGVDSHMRTESKHNQLPNERTSGLRDGCLLKLPKSSGKFASFPRSKRVEVNARPARNSDSFVKDKESILSDELVVKPSFSNLKSKMNGKRSALKKPRTHRSISKMGEQVGARPLNIEEQYNCVHDSAENLPGSYQIGVTCNSDGSSDKVRPEVEEIFDRLSFDGVGVLTPRREREAARISERGKPMITEEASHSGAKSWDLDMDATIETRGKTPLQKIYRSNNFTDNIDGLETGAEDVPVNADTVTKSFSRKAVGLPISKSTFPSEFHSLPTSLDARTNSLQSTGELKRCVCGIETMMPVQQKLSASQVTYTTNEVRGIREDTDMESEVNFEFLGISSSEGQYTRCETGPPFFPAPPGSLLPSLWDTNSEDLKENSSLTSNEMLFTQDRHAVVDTDSSESPVSATSTISHPTLVRYDVKFSDTESCPSAVQDRLILGFSGGSTEPIVGDATSSLFMISAERPERINLDGENFSTPTKESVKFKHDQPCCCSWKKSLSFVAAPTYHNPQFPKQHNRELSTIPAKGKQMAYNTNTRTAIFDKSNSFPVSRNIDMVAPICESPRGSVSIHPSPDVVRWVTSHDDFSPGHVFSQVQDVQSTSNPVLRLMGKNLMVVNKDEEASVKLRQPPADSSNTCTSIKCTNLVRLSPGVVSNQDCVYSHLLVPEGSVVSSQDSCNPQPHFFSDNLSKRFGSDNCSRTHMVGKHNNMDMGETDSSSLMWHGLASRTNLQIQEKKHTSRLDAYPYNVERMVAPAHVQHLNHVSGAQMVGNGTGEVIVINDSPGGEAELGKTKAKHRDGLNGSHPSVDLCESLGQSAFCLQTSSNPFLRVEALAGTKRNLSGASTSHAKWGGSGVTLRNPFITSSTTCHMTMYNSPSLP